MITWLLRGCGKYSAWVSSALLVGSLGSFFGCAAGTALSPQQAISPGARLFNGYAKADVRCFECHNGDGSGGKGPNLAERVPKRTDSQILSTIDNGAGLWMPSYKNKLTNNEKNDLVSWLRSRFGEPH